MRPSFTNLGDLPEIKFSDILLGQTMASEVLTQTGDEAANAAFVAVVKESSEVKVFPTIDDLKNPALIKDQLLKQNGHGNECATVLGNLLAIFNHEPTTSELFRYLGKSVQDGDPKNEETRKLAEHLERIRKDYATSRYQLRRLK